MYGKKVKLRALFLFAALLTLILTIFLVIKSLEENVVYFISPSEIKNTVKIKVIKINDTNKNLNLTLRPYMVQKLVICGVS